MDLEKGDSALTKESESKDKSWESLANSKKQCPHCKERALFCYVDDYDDDGEAAVFIIDCLNCGFKYVRDMEFEKEDQVKGTFLEALSAKIDSIMARTTKHQAATRQLEKNSRRGLSELAKIVAEL